MDQQCWIYLCYMICLFKKMLNNKKLIFFLIFISIGLRVQSQNLIFKSECFIGGETHTLKIDTIKSNEKLDLNFYNKQFKEFVPSYFPNDFTTKKTKNIPLVSDIENGYKIEYFDDKNLLVKYSIYENKNPSFDVNIFYLQSNVPYKLIEYFPDLHHSENGIFTIQYDLGYNGKDELIEIETIDNVGYKCRIQKIN